ncbi:MAG: NAD(P)H-binding protein [Bacteroidia bacterium]|jgi:uncharacterized protein YbjT (DUF2867 family)
MAKTALVLGASGLVGNELLHLLLKDSHFDKVKIFVRKPIAISHKKLEQHIINFDAITDYKEFIKGDVFFCCIGTTINTAGSKEAFIKVDYTYPTEFAKIAKTNNVKHFLFISSIGADENSSNFYLMVKGDTENTLTELDFEKLDIVRPSLLTGKRNEIRFGEIVGKVVMKALSFLFIGKLRKYKPIEATTVAKAMIKLSAQKTNAPKKNAIVLSDQLQALGGQ